MAETLLGAIYRETFGQGTNELASTEAVFVIFLLGLLAGVLLMGAFFAWQLRRERRKRELPRETRWLLEELEEDGDLPGKPGEDPARNPWSREGDWWKE